MRKWLLIASLAVLIANGAVLGFYWFGGGFRASWSPSAADWGDFGSYFGGVLTPLTSFVTILLLVVTIHQQEFSARQLSDGNLKRDHLRFLSDVRRDIQFLLDRELETLNGVAAFGDYVLGITNEEPTHSSSYRSLIRHLVGHVGEYAEALALYHGNIGVQFDFRFHHARAAKLIEFLEANVEALDPAGQITLGFAMRHLGDIRDAIEHAE